MWMAGVELGLLVGGWGLGQGTGLVTVRVRVTERIKDRVGVGLPATSHTHGHHCFWHCPCCPSRLQVCRAPLPTCSLFGWASSLSAPVPPPLNCRDCSRRVWPKARGDTTPSCSNPHATPLGFALCNIRHIRAGAFLYKKNVFFYCKLCVTGPVSA